MHYARWQVHGDPLAPTRPYQPRGERCEVDGCSRPQHGRGLCKRHWQQERRTGAPTSPPATDAFWAKVDKDGPGGCWLWTGYTSPRGYGDTGRYGLSRTRLAHRIAYELTLGRIPEGMQLDHLCRVRRCVNPEHLEPVTPRENIARGDGGASWGYVPEPVGPVVRTRLPRTASVEERFWAKVRRAEASDCWLWVATINKRTGYGSFTPRHGKVVSAHRFSYELAHGPIPEGLDVHHECHRRRCVNPAHLLAVPRAENLRRRKPRRVT